MFHFQAVQLNFVRLMLGLLLQPTSSRRKFVLLLARFRANVERQLADRRHIVDGATQLVQLFANAEQLTGIRGQIVAITFACFATVLLVSTEIG